MAGSGNTTREETIAMVNYYSAHHRRRMDGMSPGEGPLKTTHCAWFRLAPLMAFLKDIQSKYGADGVRVYFGAHNKPEDLYYGHNNVIFVGTTSDGSRNWDLDPNRIDGSDYAYSAQPSKQALDDDDLDNGHLCPPGCDGGETI